MRTLPVLLFLALSASAVFAQVPSAALTGERTFQSPTATAAQKRYVGALEQARKAYATELEPALKAAMTGGSLEEANTIADLKKRLEAGGMPATVGQNFKTIAANDARARFEKAFSNAQRQYATDLNPALKAAMTAGQLNEANAINDELKALGATAIAPSVAAAASTPPPLGTATAGRTAQGLLLTRYALHPTQKDGNRYTGYVALADLGKPLGAPRTVRTVSSWTKELEENAVVAGLIRIDQPGTYQFRTDSGYDRNELMVDGKIVCKFRDGDKKFGTIDLRPGLLPIVSIGYAHSTTEVRVQWKPPGAADFSDIPSNLFSH